MKRALFIFVTLIFCHTANSFAQENRLYPDSIQAGLSADTGRMESLAPMELEGLFNEMTVDIPTYGEVPEYNREEMRVLQQKLFDELPRYPVLPLWSGQNAYPFLSTTRSRFYGLDMAGLGTSFRITPWLTADVSAYLSGAYMGMEYPNKYMNASLSGTLRIKLHDRIYLVGMGEISAREGLNPKFAPGIGGKNSLGAGVEIFITEKFGITFSRTWEYYQGSWYGHNNYGPIMRQGRPR